jgi:hypothetical protein
LFFARDAHSSGLAIRASIDFGPYFIFIPCLSVRIAYTINMFSLSSCHPSLGWPAGRPLNPTTLSITSAGITLARSTASRAWFMLLLYAEISFSASPGPSSSFVSYVLGRCNSIMAHCSAYAFVLGPCSLSFDRRRLSVVQ